MLEPTRRRKTALNQILENTQRDIVLWQECSWKDPLDHIGTNFLDHQIKRGEEAGIIWNSSVFAKTQKFF